VRVDEAGHDHTARCIQAGLVRIGDAQFVGCPYGDDLLVADKDGAVLDDAQHAERASALGAACKCQELGCGVDEHNSVISFQ